MSVGFCVNAHSFFKIIVHSLVGVYQTVRRQNFASPSPRAEKTESQNSAVRAGLAARGLRKFCLRTVCSSSTSLVSSV